MAPQNNRAASSITVYSVLLVLLASALLLVDNNTALTITTGVAFAIVFVLMLVNLARVGAANKDKN